MAETTSLPHTRRPETERHERGGAMITRRHLLTAIPATALIAHPAARALAQGVGPASAPGTGKNGVMLMNRIGPSASELYIANSDGTGERKLLPESVFDYHASYSADGKWIIFTSERTGPGQADIYRARADGTAVERLTDSEAVDDQAALAPDGTSVAFVSTRETYKANIWILDLETQRLRNLTGQSGIQGDADKPGGFFRPAWSPDGQWLAFSSDRNTAWRARKGAWEHIQELSVYVIGADGTGLRRVSNSQPGVCAGSPKWSADGKRVVFYELPVEQTWHAHRPELVASATSQIVSVDVATGELIEHTSGPGLKVLPQFVTANRIGYLAKGGPNEGLAYTGGGAAVKGNMRSPVWSPDGKKVIYQKVDRKSTRLNSSHLGISY